MEVDSQAPFLNRGLHARELRASRGEGGGEFSDCRVRHPGVRRVGRPLSEHRLDGCTDLVHPRARDAVLLRERRNDDPRHIRLVPRHAHAAFISSRGGIREIVRRRELPPRDRIEPEGDVLHVVVIVEHGDIESEAEDDLIEHARVAGEGACNPPMQWRGHAAVANKDTRIRRQQRLVRDAAIIPLTAYALYSILVNGLGS